MIVPQTLFHYTNQIGYNGIMSSKQLNASTRTTSPNDIRYGEGQYLTDIVPRTKTLNQLSRAFIGNPFQGRKYTHYIEIDVSQLNVVTGRAGVHVIPNQQPLDISNLIISHGKVF